MKFISILLKLLELPVLYFDVAIFIVFMIFFPDITGKKMTGF